ncbi:MAG: MgtC/SapB family protein, partial [Candidatus Woesearchaeota archaeon]
SFAGIRTFPLIAVAGSIIAYLGTLTSLWFLMVGSLACFSLIVAAYINSTKDSKYPGITTAVAALISFLVGILVIYEQATLAVIIAITTAILLYAQNFLHQFAKKIKREELADTLKFAVIAFVILPFLPNKGYGPHEIFNPFVIWLMVVFISGISFAGYILMKWFGEKGIELAGIFGGLVSSTAVTSSFSNRSKKENLPYALALGVILANTVMFFRILVVAFVINRNLVLTLLLPIGILAVISLVFSYFLYQRAKKVKNTKIELPSPFTLTPALKFGVFFALILALVKIADLYFSSNGIYLISVFSGFADVAAITISLSQLAKETLASNIARNGIIIAALTNIAVKGGIAYLFGSKKFSRIVIGLYLLLILVGVGLIFLI